MYNKLEWEKVKDGGNYDTRGLLVSADKMQNKNKMIQIMIKKHADIHKQGE